MLFMMVIPDLLVRKIKHMDSMGEQVDEKWLETMVQYFAEEAQEKKSYPFDRDIHRIFHRPATSPGKATMLTAVCSHCCSQIMPPGMRKWILIKAACRTSRAV